MSEPDLSRLKTTADYQAQNSHVFPSETALLWFMRRRREKLVSSHAFVVVNRRVLVDAEIFDRVVMEVGREVAEAAEAAASQSSALLGGSTRARFR